MTDPETYEVTIHLTGPTGATHHTTSTVTVPATARRFTKMGEVRFVIARDVESILLKGITVSREDFITPLDTVRDDERAAGGSSFRGLLPAGATPSLAEDEQR